MLHLTNTTLQKLPLSSKLLSEISTAILGADFDVSLVIVGEKKALSLNKKYRNKTYIPNVLSFPLDTDAGEIFLNPKTARSEARNFNLSVTHYLYYLIVHSLLHLKNMDHGADMSAQEQQIMKRFFNIEIDF